SFEEEEIRSLFSLVFSQVLVVYFDLAKSIEPIVNFFFSSPLKFQNYTEFEFSNSIDFLSYSFDFSNCINVEDYVDSFVHGTEALFMNAVDDLESAKLFILLKFIRKLKAKLSTFFHSSLNLDLLNLRRLMQFYCFTMVSRSFLDCKSKSKYDLINSVMKRFE